MALRRRRTAIAVATVALVAPLAISCSAVEKALDCAQTAHAIAGSVSDLQQAAQDAAENPLQADKALDRIDENLGEITDKTDNVDVDKGVNDLQKAVDNVRTAIKNGDNTPDLGPVLDASGEITKACTS